MTNQIDKHTDAKPAVVTEIKKERKRRAWVKPAAIIFFVVILLLTFFSNTIMNYSLAEVDTNKVAAGKITAKVRGDGTVQASDTYEVTLKETRKVEQVFISAGETVKEGDLLFRLDDSKSTELETAQDTLNELKLAYQQSILDSGSSDSSTERKAVTRAEEDLTKANSARSAYGASTMTVAQATEAVRLASGKKGELEATISILERQKDAAEAGNGAYASLQQQIDNANTQLDTAGAELRSAQSTLEKETNIAAADADVRLAQQTLDDARDALTKAAEQESNQTAKNNLSLTSQREKIARQEEVVAELLENTVGTELTAKSGGVVTSVSAKAGTSTVPDTPIAVIAVEDKGFSAEISLTKEQAKEFKVGDTAEAKSSTAWNTQITATIETIKDDLTDSSGGGGETSGTASNSRQGKIVVFSLEGDVALGETLTFTLSQKSKQYDTLVPNSAVKTDSNGTFVLMITEKSTPLGTRYVASRVDVTVAGKDDTSSAVTGGISQYDSVITSASKTVEPGDYLRLAEKG